MGSQAALTEFTELHGGGRTFLNNTTYLYHLWFHMSSPETTVCINWICLQLVNEVSFTMVKKIV